MSQRYFPTTSAVPRTQNNEKKRITQSKGGRYKLEIEIPGTYPAISHEVGICRFKQTVSAFRRGSL